MRDTRSRWSLVGVAVVLGVACWGGREVTHAAPSAAVAPAVAAPKAMQADLRIRQIQVAADGTPLGVSAPGVMLHVDRHLQSGHWHLTMSLGGVDRPTVTTPRGVAVLENPFLVNRLDYDEDAGGEPVLYDRAGRRIGVAGDAERRRIGLAASLRRTTWDPDVLAGQVGRAPLPAGGRPITTSLVVDAAETPVRRQHLEARYGRAVGRLRGFDRYLLSTAVQTEETLATPDTALPVEVNVVRSGRLASHIQLTYDRNQTLGFVRRLLHSEVVSNDATGARVVTDVEMANLIVDGGAR